MNRKTVIVNYTGRRGGGAVYAYEMTKSLLRNGCTVYAILSKEIENLRVWRELPLEDLVLLKTYSNKVNYITNTILFKLAGLSKLKRKFENIKISVVYVPMIQPWSNLINSIFKDSQIIVTAHDPKPHSGTGYIYKRICKKCAVEADDIVVLSNSFREYTEKLYHRGKEKIHVIPHGIVDYYKDVATSTSTVKYDPGKINFLFFGRITKYKGLHILAKAYQRLSEEYDNITLSVVGSGNFKKYIKEYEKLKNVTVVNRWIKDEEVGSFFIGDNIITVLPYIDATQSGVIPMAMVYKSLVITSDTGGLSEQVVNKETGYLVPPGDWVALYKIMRYVVENYDEQKNILEKAHTQVELLNWDEMGKSIVEIIN